MSEKTNHQLTTLTRSLLLVVLLLTGHSVLAQQQLDVRTVAQKEEVTTMDDGSTETRLVPAERVLPGDKVVYTITFTNVGDESADDVVVTNPIDASLTYLEGSAFGAGMTIEFSADGGRTFAAADALTVSSDGGERPATVADYTHVRWTMNGALDTGSTGTARFSAIVD